MTDKIVVNSGFFASLLNVLRRPAVIWVIALLGWWWGGSQWLSRETTVKARLEKASRRAERVIAKENALISENARQRMKSDRQRQAQRRQAERESINVLGRYQGRTDAVLPADVHGAIQEVR